MLEMFVLFGVMLVLIILGLPVSFSIGLSCIAYIMLFLGETMLVQLPTKMYASNDSTTLLAVPMFIFSGYLMEVGGISKRLIDFICRMTGGLPGALGTVAIISCMIFAALTGSAIATIAAIGSIVYPLMKKAGYSDKVAAGLICASGALGPIIPPSIPMVLYGSAMGVPVSNLFIGGVLPGIVIGVVLIIVNTVYAIKIHLPNATRKYTAKEKLETFWRSLGLLILPIIILGGIYGGYVTATEAATISVIYTTILMLFYGSLSVKSFISAAKKTILTTGAIMAIVNISNLFGYVLSVENLPARIVAAITPLISSPSAFMIIMFVLLVVIGALMDSSPAILILAPMIAPVGVAFGINPIILGVMFCCVLCMGAITPPFGVGLFTFSATMEMPFGKVVKGTLPFALVAFAVLLVFTIFPSLLNYAIA